MENTTYLKNLKNTIEKLDLCHHKKILEIIITENISYSENKNGVFINMNRFDDNIINKIKGYIQYVETQEQTLKQYESMKHNYKKNYFNLSKEDKEKLSYTN